MRTISSFKFVGELLPPINVGRPLASTALLFGKIPAVSKAVAFGAIMQDGILLPGNGDPCTTPAGAAPPGKLANRTLGVTCALVGTLIPVELVLKPPPYEAGSGTVWFVRPPLTYLRHSML